MLKRLKVRIDGVSAMLMHNGQLANPMNEWAKAMKKITSKRKKTDDDLIELARLEFMGGLYVDEAREPCIPGHCIEGYFARAAKTIRKGKEGVAGISSDGNWPLIYDGPRDPDKMWESGKFYDSRGAKVNGSKVQRTRPLFPKWALEFEVIYDTEILDLEQIKDILAAGALTNGLGDYVPKFGRFVVKWIKELGPVAVAA